MVNYQSAIDGAPTNVSAVLFALKINLFTRSQSFGLRLSNVIAKRCDTQHTTTIGQYLSITRLCACMKYFDIFISIAIKTCDDII